MSDVILRALLPDDRPRIAEILDAVGVFRPEEVAVGLELVDEATKGGDAAGYYWKIAANGDAVLGFACFGPVPMTQGTFDLYWIAVDPRAQGRKVAGRLEGAVEADAVGRGGRWLLAETSSLPDYTPAHRFYAARGYALVGRIADYYRPGDDRLTFGKRLDTR